MKRCGSVAAVALIAGGLVCAGIAFLTLRDLAPVGRLFAQAWLESGARQVTDRFGTPLSANYGGAWNTSDLVPLYDIPEDLVQAFIVAEDKRFYAHAGIDWRARAQAFVQNVRCLCADRGASTVTEQVVRMLAPRPRTLWTRWVEGWDAQRLERAATKADILEFYLNQVPYAANRRGVVQAARYYFNRDLSTLSRREMLALAVLVRAPGRYRLRENPSRLDRALARLAARMEPPLAVDAGQPWAFAAPALSVEASHFVRFARSAAGAGAGRIRTTLDGPLQKTVQTLLDRRMVALSANRVHNGAVLVADHRTGEILAWANAGAGDPEVPGGAIDAVLTPRQPGSALKPFIYALALEKGWTAATVIDDAPLSEAVGAGLHAYRNYSRKFYGPVTLRQALANSLNIPAVKAVQFVGAEAYLEALRRIGFTGLAAHPDFYGDGIALGNGEVTLFQVVQAYAALANKGMARPLHVVTGARSEKDAPGRVAGEGAASLIANILSDAAARDLEFGEGSVLDMPVQTAVKTGTSTDFRDAWAVGFTHRYVVGVWMGNLDRTPTDGVSGARGPALLLRSVFAELNKKGSARPLFLSPSLESRTVCTPSPAATAGCVKKTEWFLPGTAERVQTGSFAPESPSPSQAVYRLSHPLDGLRMAIDPRVPLADQAFLFRAQTEGDGTVEWVLDGRSLGRGRSESYLWALERGGHALEAVFYDPQGVVRGRDRARFTVR